MSFGIKEDRYAEEEIQAGRDRREAAAGGCAGLAKSEHGRCGPQIGVSEVAFYCWSQEFGGLKADQVKRLEDLELENSPLLKAVSDLTLDKLILREVARGNF